MCENPLKKFILKLKFVIHYKSISKTIFEIRKKQKKLGDIAQFQIKQIQK